MTPDERANLILNEENPVHREIWSMGYDAMIVDAVNDELKLLKTDSREEIKLDLYEFKKLVRSLNIKKVILITGKIHQWISEADGSCERFRSFIMEAEKRTRVVLPLGPTMVIDQDERGAHLYKGEISWEKKTTFIKPEVEK